MHGAPQRRTGERWRVGFPSLRSAPVDFVVGIELESRNTVTIFIKSKIGNFVCRIRKLVNSFGDLSMTRSSTKVKLMAAGVSQQSPRLSYCVLWGMQRLL